MPNFAKVAAPLTNLTKKASSYYWDDACQMAVDKLKG